MLRRKAIDRLIEWKDNPNKKSLIINGARQVGKTYAVRAFAKEHYASFVEINFLEHPEYTRIFDGNLDVDSLLMNLSVVLGSGKLIPGETLILFDEIQECQNAIVSLKFWTENKAYDVIGTGSALGISYKNRGSYPVGYVEYMDMYPLDFEEFLWANDISNDVISSLYKHFTQKEKIPAAIDSRMLQLLRLYMIVGGMPEIVQSYVDTKDLSLVDSIQRRLYRDYLADIAHYAEGSVKIKAEKCYKSIALQLSKENHKFQYSVVESKATSSKYGDSIEWLKNAGLITEIIGLKDIKYPPELLSDDTNFRIYPTDIGMLMAAFDFTLKRAILEDGALEENANGLVMGTVKGSLYEALAADILYKRGYKKLFFYKDSKSTSEVEFLIVNEDGLIPIEIKAGRKKANSLGKIIESKKVPYGYKLSSKNIGECDGKITLPLYMLMFL